MQAACPQCAQKITVDDARVPDRPFAVKCPKCQATVRFPGRAPGAAAPAPAPASVAPASAGAPGAAAAPAPGPEPLSEEARAASAAQLRREVVRGDAGGGRKVLVALADRGLATALTQPLVNIGYVPEVLDTPEEGGRMLEDGLFEVVVTTRTAPVPGRAETLYQRILRLGPSARRRLFLVLVGEEYKTADGMQAFALQADLVVNPRDAAGVEGPLLAAINDRNRLYQSYRDARRNAGID